MGELAPARCFSCRFYEALPGDEDRGICRRWAPNPVLGYVVDSTELGAKTGAFAAMWPEVEFSEWCGQYEAQAEEAS